MAAVDAGLVRRFVRTPGADDHKYSRGVVGFVTGSTTYPGAALIGVEAALRTGVGMVRYLGPLAVGSMVVAKHPEVVLAGGSVDALVVGSGIPDQGDGAAATGEDAQRIREAAALGVPTVLDAGGLGFAELFGPATVLTPHSGELEALYLRLDLGHASADLDRALAVAERLGQRVLVKGSTTRVVSPEGSVLELPVATGWLATAGTGDALAGIMGALVAANHQAVFADPGSLGPLAAAAAMVHQMAAARASVVVAGDHADSAGGPITVGDLCHEIGWVISNALID